MTDPEDLLENKNRTLQKFSCFHNFASFNVNYFVNWMAVEDESWGRCTCKGGTMWGCCTEFVERRTNSHLDLG